MNVGIIGSGSVGKALGSGFASRGNDVMIGTREPDRPELVQWAAGHTPRARVGTNAEATVFGELIVFCTRWSGAQNAVAPAGAQRFAGKVVIDTMNPIGQDALGRLVLTVGRDTSSAETLQAWLPAARVVKAFNYIGAQLVVDPDLPGGPPTGFLAGDDAEAKAVVAGILAEFGLEPIDLGGLIEARGLEAMVCCG